METTKHGKDYLDRQIQGVIDGILQLRDTVRVDLHLASMDARDKWNADYEPQIFKLQEKAKKAGHEVKEELHRAAVNLADDIRKFANSIK